MASCEEIPSLIYRDGEKFSTWWGGMARARSIAREKADIMAHQIVRQHNLKYCWDAKCTGTYVGCDCHPGEFVPHEYACAAYGEFKIVLRIDKLYKTWFGGSGGDFTVGIEGKVSCKCVVPTLSGEPFDFLGLINIIGGVGKSIPQHLQTAADLIEWMKKNLK